MRASPGRRPLALRVAIWASRALTRLYPRAFREDVGRELLRDSAALAEASHRRGGTPAVASLLFRLTGDAIRVAVRERIRPGPSGRVGRRGFSGIFMDAFVQDARYAVRTLARFPGYTAAVIVTLALGIGANTAIFSVVNGVILQPLPYANDGRLALLHQAIDGDAFGFSVPEIEDIRARSRTLDEVVEYHSLDFTLLGNGDPELVRSGVVSWNYFRTLGVDPLLGRTFRREDDVPGAPAVLVLSYRYWRDSFGGDLDVIGTRVEMHDRPHTIVGVLPPVPHYPRENDVYMPTVACPYRSSPAWIESRTTRGLVAVGRVRETVSEQDLAADLRHLGDGLHADHPDAYSDAPAVTAMPLKRELTQSAQPTLLALMGTVGLVLLVACMNVANLTLARLVRRGREMAVRTALGAGRRRLARQLFTESLVLTLIGGGLGLVLASVGLDLVIEFTAQYTPRAREVSLDGSTLLFTALVSVGAALVLGSLPALPSRGGVTTRLQDGGRHAGGGPTHARLRTTLVVAQLAGAFALLVGAVLVGRGLIALQRVDDGIDDRDVVTMAVAVPFRSPLHDDPVPFLDSILTRARAVPGVRRVAVASSFPLSPSAEPGFATVTIGEDATQEVRIRTRHVGPEYFATIGQSVRTGRGFTSRDRIGADRVAVVNQEFARAYFESGDPIGRRLRVGMTNNTPWTIVGVVGNVRQSLEDAVHPELYVPMFQTAGSAFTRLLASGNIEGVSFARTMAAIVSDFAPDAPITEVATLTDFRRRSLASPRFTAVLFGGFAILTVLITATGIAGLVAFSVAQRTKEIGLRIALGAGSHKLLAGILGHGMRITALGLGIGAVAALAGTRALARTTIAVDGAKGLAFAVAAIVIVGITAVATLVPARAATAIAPMEALRKE